MAIVRYVPSDAQSVQSAEVPSLAPHVWWSQELATISTMVDVIQNVP